MANAVVQLKLTRASQEHVEVVVLHKTGSWKSPGGGWLDTAIGTWSYVVMPEKALVLKSEGKEIGRCMALVFETAAVPDTGRLIWMDGADGTGWKVFATETA